MAMEEIKKLSETYSDAHRQLADVVSVLLANIEQAKREAMPQLREAVRAHAAAEAELTAAVQADPALFEKPKTQIFSGIKVGFRKAKGKIEIDDEEKTIALIRKHLPEDQAELLIRVSESVDKNAVGPLTVDDLKRVAIRVTNDTDVVVIKPTDSDVEKMVNAFLKDAGARVEKEAGE